MKRVGGGGDDNSRTRKVQAEMEEDRIRESWREEDDGEGEDGRMLMEVRAAGSALAEECARQRTVFISKHSRGQLTQPLLN